jgi:hypothetical protein
MLRRRDISRQGRGSHEVPLNMPENAGESYWEKMKKMKMQVQVFRICTYPNKSNAFGIGDREENWILRRDDVVFTNEEDAKEYVRDKSRALTILPNLLISLPHAARPAFVDEFCFGDGYWADRRFFLGPPPVDKIIDALKCMAFGLPPAASNMTWLCHGAATRHMLVSSLENNRGSAGTPSIMMFGF